MPTHAQSPMNRSQHHVLLPDGQEAYLGEAFTVGEILNKTDWYILVSAIQTAKHDELPRDCTLEVPTRGHRPALSFDDQIRRMDLEVQIGESAQHPNLVKVYRKEDTPAGPVIVMEPLAKGNLSERIGNGLPFTDALVLFEKLCQAVDTLHQCPLLPIVHCNISSDSVYFGRNDDEPKMGGLTTAQIIADETFRSIPLAPYLCPELLRNRN